MPPFAQIAGTTPQNGGPVLLQTASPNAASQPGGAADVGFDPTRIVPVLDDPRLAAVKASVDREAYLKAANELETLLTAASLPGAPPGAGAPPSADDIAAWRYQLGRLRALAGDPTSAAKAFDEAAEAGGLLADYARFHAAFHLESAEQHDAALERARKIPAGLPFAPELELITASALAGKGEIDAASAAWRSYLGRQRNPPQWVNVTLKFARALLAHPSDERAEEAIKLARRVRFEAPRGEGSGEAKQIETDALAVLPFAKRKAFESPDPNELLARAKALLSSQQNREALAAAEALIALPAAQKPGELACEAFITRADALGKVRRKAESADAFGEAVEKCAGQSRRVEALYNAGRASEKAGRSAEVMKRFAMLEAEFPKHRLADDARYKGARAARELGDEAAFERMLAEMPDAYPEGDMVNDGLFELALARVERRDWAGSIAPLERAFARAPRERTYYAAGRLPYFLGRARIETGSVDKGVELLASTVRSFPLTYYMALAHARLAERDPAAAAAALKDATGQESEGPFILPKSPIFEQPAFLRAVLLARHGEGKLARGELDTLGLKARTAPPELLWASVFLLARAGSPGSSHSILRAATLAHAPGSSELTDWLDHYPVGRWRAAWEAAYPRPFAALVTAEAKRSGIPEALAHAIMREESAFDPRVVSHASAVGLMQLIVPTAKNMAKPLGLPWNEAALKRPEVNIALGCRFLSILRAKFPDNPLLAIPGYNAGAGMPKKWIAARPTHDFDLWVERIPYEETRLYTKRVITSMAAYEFLYADLPSGEALRSPRAASSLAAAAAAGTAASAPGTTAPPSSDSGEADSAASGDPKSSAAPAEKLPPPEGEGS
jgi:soluble lytic murein transglycosylase